MKELWLIIVVAVGILFVISVALLTKKKQAFRDDAFLTIGGTLLVLGIIFGDDRLVGYSFIGLSVLMSIISAVRDSRKK